MADSVGLSTILRKNLDEIDYEDIASFCNLGQPEGVYLDYKKDIPSSLSKQFASFSNKSGGLIIIGIEEDKPTGTPVRWDGVEFDSKDIERIHQIAANTDPLPLYDLKGIKKNKGDTRGFILIRVYEGADPPYMLVNQDGSVWVRTGNISKECEERASLGELQNLLNKKSASSNRRLLNERFAEDVFYRHLDLVENTRQELLREGEPVVLNRNADNASLLEIVLQPAFLKPDTIPQYEILSFLREGSNSKKFPISKLSYEPVPGGVSGFSYDSIEGKIMNLQVYGSGMIYLRFTLGIGVSTIRTLTISTYLLGLLHLGKDLFLNFGYVGNLYGSCNMLNLQQSNMEPIGTGQSKPALMGNYDFDFVTDTLELNDPSNRNRKELSLLDLLHLDLGFEYKSKPYHLVDFIDQFES